MIDCDFANELILLDQHFGLKRFLMWILGGIFVLFLVKYAAPAFGARKED